MKSDRHTRWWLVAGVSAALVSAAYLLAAATGLFGSPTASTHPPIDIDGMVGAAIVVPLVSLTFPAIAILSGLVLWASGTQKRVGVGLVVLGVLLVFGNLLTRLVSR